MSRNEKYFHLNQVNEPTNIITLYAADLEVSQAKLKSTTAGKKTRCFNISSNDRNSCFKEKQGEVEIDAENERVKIKFDQNIDVNQ